MTVEHHLFNSFGIKFVAYSQTQKEKKNLVPDMKLVMLFRTISRVRELYMNGENFTVKKVLFFDIPVQFEFEYLVESNVL